MSAYIVDNRTIDYLVSWISHGDRSHGSFSTRTIWPKVDDVPESLRPCVDGDDRYGWRLRLDIMPATDIGRILMAENVRSVTARYGESKLGTDETGAADAYTFRPVVDLRPEWVVSSAACLNYQSCETEDWERTVAHAIMSAIRESAIHAWTRRTEAPWGVTDADLNREWKRKMAAYAVSAVPVTVGESNDFGCRV